MLSEVRLCNKCWWRKWLTVKNEGPCGSVPDARRIQDARKKCEGKLWKPKPPVSTGTNLWDQMPHRITEVGRKALEADDG